MGKVTIHIGRGTSTIEVDDNPANWSGKEFKMIQEARKNSAANTSVVTGRGTSRRRLLDTPDSLTDYVERKSTVGRRGTVKL